MKELYLEIFNDIDSDGFVNGPLETLIVLFAHQFSNETKEIQIIFQIVPQNGLNVSINVTNINYEICSELPLPATLCQLPVLVILEDSACIAGLCAVIRQIFKTQNPLHPLLGFKQNSLYACAESSIWTKFCEIDIVATTKSVIESKLRFIPSDLTRFETHMDQPVRMHNIEKVKREMSKDEQLSNFPSIHHTFVEGPSASIADVILFVCFHIINEKIKGQELFNLIPLTTKWLETMKQMDETKSALKILGPIEKISHNGDFYKISNGVSGIMYKSETKSYKPKSKIFTKQEDVEESLAKIINVDLDMIEKNPFGEDVAFDWETVPWHAQPAGGELPAKRANRKAQQLEGMARAVLKIARNGDTIVDFCAGSGHLGIILAHFLPRCTIILLENKEESLNRARERSSKLKLNNVFFCQSNVDYFKKNFSMGVSLHACGVATDLVMEICIQRKAVFVCCPCCYGSIQPNHMVKYPRSEKFNEIPLTERQYLVLGHAADQVHDAANAKTKQGLICMDLIDADRCFYARELGYQVKLAKLYPLSCTPKNNLLIGIPPDR